MGGGSVVFYIFLAIMIVLLLRWSIRVFFTDPKRVTMVVPEDTRRRARTPAEVRRTTVYTITADPRATDPANNFPDCFWDISPQTSRQRDELGKDDKDLPSYEEVMQMEMRQQVLDSTTIPTTTSVTSLTPMTTLTPATNLTPATPGIIVPAAITTSTV